MWTVQLCGHGIGPSRIIHLANQFPRLSRAVRQESLMAELWPQTHGFPSVSAMCRYESKVLSRQTQPGLPERALCPLGAAAIDGIELNVGPGESRKLLRPRRCPLRRAVSRRLQRPTQAAAPTHYEETRAAKSRPLRWAVPGLPRPMTSTRPVGGAQRPMSDIPAAVGGSTWGESRATRLQRPMSSLPRPRRITPGQSPPASTCRQCAESAVV